MTVREAIRRADRMRPNTISEEEKCLWLAQLDGLLRREVLEQAAPCGAESGTGNMAESGTGNMAESGAQGGENAGAESGAENTAESGAQAAAAQPGADISTQDDTALLAAEPYSALYLYWLMAQTDLALGELTRYSNDMLLYNAALAEYAAAYRAAHAPRPRGQFRL